MFRRGIASEIRWLLLYLFGAMLLGAALDAVLATLLYAALVYIAWLFFRLHQLAAWMESARHRGPKPHDFSGVWGEMAEDVILLSKRYEKDKVRLQDVVARVQEMTTALPDSVIIVDKRGNIEWWNKAAEWQFALEARDRGHKLTNYIRQPVFVSYYDSGQYDEPLEMNSSQSDATCLEFHIHPFGAGDRLVIARDVTHVSRLERMRKDFVANVSHELRTPLTVLCGYLETLTDIGGAPKAWLRPMSEMQQQAKRMNALINDLLMLSRLETEDTENDDIPVQLHPMLQGIVRDAVALSGDRQHQLSLNCDEQVALYGNEQELRSAIANLVFNAVNYTPATRRIDIEVSGDEHELVVAVKDSGEGIDPKHLPRLTERFYRVDKGRSSETGGTGLGLAIVKHILWRHNAELDIESKLGKGSTFSCHFPRQRVVVE
ncbi:phosphate regulon sensor histidine kinase PhoR [Teredinibacter waterburyi]|jgi:PAS/PAC sensor signal transduction histidine kinase (EC 2.7.13.3)|uniref:phosphate regulon sensor histidine kinase PhoR n=1 Tax=Teredinibacter waterburyi TaxID=1500538 RepID=UPI00165FCA9D|nr:phosphate regulon sensor histidine kinase PhoR [Teredinibacter waterburyi]